MNVMRKAVLLVRDEKIRRQLTPLLGRSYRVSAGEPAEPFKEDSNLFVLDRAALHELLAKAGVPRASVEQPERRAGFAHCDPDYIFEFASNGTLT